MKKALIYLGICILLVVPLIFTALNNNGFSLQEIIVGTLGITLLLFVIYDLLKEPNPTLAILFFVGSLICLLLVRLTFAMVYDFSGRGFSSEFFAHFGKQSFMVGLDEYGYVLLFIIVSLCILLILLIKLLNKQKQYKLRTNIILLFVSLGLIITTLNSSTEWNLFNSYNRYNSIILESADKSTIRAETNAILKPLRPTSKLPIEKHEIIATAATKPKNIIIIYLESFSEILTENKQYPNLTPNLDRLKVENTSFTNNFSSAYITIEGIANSQCGTLMNMDNGNNSLTSATGRLANLPCLGDILHKAGYKQVFYGGALLEFSGKGAFLSEHGYDEVKGLNDWRKKGHDNEVIWGLADTNLYDEALQKILELNKQEQPFNLTLLTLGTHVPGFFFETCSQYKGITPAEPFLDAIHCTDYLIGQFIQQLKNHNILQDTVVYIQGDHALFFKSSMKDLFGEMVVDKRVVSIIVDEDTHNLPLDTAKPTTTVNMVANILHLLDIKHNVDFILARSDFKESTDKPYLLTRYNDYYGMDIIYNSPKNVYCDYDNSYSLSFPLNSCEKRKALNAVYRLGSSYSSQLGFQQVCEKGVKISVDSISKQISVKWGDKDLSQQFFSAGRKFENIKYGFYLLMLDSNDRILRQQFYRGDKVPELNWLNRELSKPNQRYVLFSNLSKEQLLTIKVKKIPNSFIENNIVYIGSKGKKVISLFDQPYNLGSIAFVPHSCNVNTKVLEYKAKKIKVQEYALIQEKLKQIKGDTKFCEIKNWGPQQTVLGENFLEQADGNSAFWLKTDCAPEKAIFRINGEKLNTHIDLPIITASVDNKVHFQKPGLYTLDLFHEESNKSIKIGEFKVKRNKKVSSNVKLR